MLTHVSSFLTQPPDPPHPINAIVELKTYCAELSFFTRVDRDRAQYDN